MSTTNRVHNPTTEKGQYDFIKGDFSAEDAQEIIRHLFTKKISFHELKSFSSEIRFGTKDQDSLDRIIALRKCMNTIEKEILLAKELSKTVRLSSKIHIELI